MRKAPCRTVAASCREGLSLGCQFRSRHPPAQPVGQEAAPGAARPCLRSCPLLSALRSHLCVALPFAQVMVHRSPVLAIRQPPEVELPRVERFSFCGSRPACTGYAAKISASRPASLSARPAVLHPPLRQHQVPPQLHGRPRPAGAARNPACRLPRCRRPHGARLSDMG